MWSVAMESKIIASFNELMLRAKNQDQADISYAMTIKTCIDIMYSMNTLREITYIYGQYRNR
jgi:hypothetical protein